MRAKKRSFLVIFRKNAYMKIKNNACIFCGHTKLYEVSSSQSRCAMCKRTFSHIKYAKKIEVLKCFLADKSAHECAMHLSLNYLTVSKIYHTLRLLLIEYLESLYTQHAQTFSQYDEYYFLPTCKKKKAKYLFDAIGILAILYDTHVYTLLLPDQFAHVRDLEEDAIEKETYARFLHQHKVAHYESFHTPINRFWIFLETWMEHFKGIKREKFIYYLKEAEFKFNYTPEAQRSILEALWQKNLYI